MATKPVYSLGHSDFELARLKLQGEILAPITRRLFEDCGISPGMKVLEIGCGAGDVSFILSQMVGPTGRVIACDRENRAIELGRARAAKLGLSNIDFQVATDQDLPAGMSCDAAVGRYVLMHQPDPVAMLQRVAALARPGGTVAFHEIAVHIMSQTSPKMKLLDDLGARTMAVEKATYHNFDLAGRMVALFSDAGLPAPDLFSQCIVGDHTSKIIEWLVTAYWSMRPMMARHGIEPVDEPDFDELCAKVRSEALAVNAQIISLPQVCAWTRI